MCGIIGYVGRSYEPTDVLVRGLSNLEYRGYDSAGVAIVNSTIEVVKQEGTVSGLEPSVRDLDIDGHLGIGHTRWSTHGTPTDQNAHPHTDCTDRVAVVHNGIIDNYRSLRERLESDGHTFESETDTEVIPHLIEEELDQDRSPYEAFTAAIDHLEGNYAIGAVFAHHDTMFAARRRSPLVLGIDDDSYYLASDVPAFREFTDRVVTLEDNHVVQVDPSGFEVTNGDGSTVNPAIETVDWPPQAVGKGQFSHYMLKEVHEQPHAIRQCVSGRIDDTSGVHIEDIPEIEPPGFVHFVACGTSYHAARYGAHLFRERGIPAQVFLASEYDPSRLPFESDTLVLGVTQSGETADTLQAIRRANAADLTTLALTNVVSSSAVREADHTMYIRAGPEICVAATKSFSSQQVALGLLACELTDSDSREYLEALQRLPEKIETVLDRSNARSIAGEISGSDAYFFIGRGLNVPVALEGALKLKEISYEHAEGFPGGELKHGPLALVTDATPVVVLLAGDESSGIRSNLHEVVARGAPIVTIAEAGRSEDVDADFNLEVPDTHPAIAPILSNVHLQLLSYWIANELGRSIDTPRNLAKSVTVE